MDSIRNCLGYWCVSAVVLLVNPAPSVAQITPDASLGSEASQVRRAVVRGRDADLIEGGAVRGANLFHSFNEFNVGAGDAAYFANPQAIRNIFGRVTGADISDIFGTLGVDGSANLFLLNPNGIVFGPNARLDVSGSFFATTGNSLLFPNGFAFTADNPQAPPLLTVNVPVGVQFGARPGAITNQATGFLIVPEGQSLNLVGGDVRFEGGRVGVVGGPIQIVSVAGAGVVGLSGGEGLLNLVLPPELPRGQISLSNGASILTLNGGDIQLQASDIILGGRSEISALTRTEQPGGNVTLDASSNIALNAAFISLQAPSSGKTGNLTLRAGNRIQMENGSFISIVVSGAGAGGSLLLETGTLSLQDSNILNSTSGSGNAGTTTIRAREAVEFSAGSSFAGGALGRTTTGRGSDLTVETQRLNLRDGSFISTSTGGQGNAGNIVVRATESVDISGIRTSPTGFINSSVSSTTGLGATGNAGHITLETGQLRLSNGGQVATSSINALGNSGNITIRARDIEVSGFATVPPSTTSPNERQLASEIASSVLTPNATQRERRLDFQGGAIAIETDRLRVRDGAEITTELTNSVGQAGDITILARESIEISGSGPRSNLTPSIDADLQTGSRGRGGDIRVTTSQLRLSSGQRDGISASVLGEGTEGTGGSITVNADQILMRGRSQITTQVGERGQGTAGRIDLNTGSLQIEDTAQVLSSLFGRGSAGLITIQAEQINIIGEPEFEDATGILSSVEPGASGQGNDIRINTERLTLRNDGSISAGTSGVGNSGAIFITADRILAQDSVISVQVDKTGTGNAGNISIDTNQLRLEDEGQISSSVSGTGDAGRITVNADQINILDNDGLFLTGITSGIQLGGIGQGGTVRINTARLTLRNGGEITAATSGQGNAGNVLITANDILLQGSSDQGGSSLFVGVGPTAVGNGGNIRVNTERLTLRDGGLISTRTSGNGRAGDVRVNASEQIIVNGIVSNTPNSSLISARTGRNATGRGGDITLITPSLQVSDGAVIVARTDNPRPGGDITINSSRVNLAQGGQIITSTLSQGRAGTIQINARERMNISGVDANFNERLEATGEGLLLNQGASSGLFAGSSRNASGNGGNIQISTPILNVFDNAVVLANSRGTGTAGRLTVNADQLRLRNNARLNIATVNSAGGRLSLNDLEFLSLDNSQIVATTNNGQGGQIQVDAAVMQLENDARISSATTGTGTAGRIGITTANLTLNNSQISAAATRGAGTAGGVRINTPNLLLDNNSSLTATTVAGTGGDVSLNDLNTLNVNNSRISASTRQGTAGNVRVNAAGSVQLNNARLEVEATQPNGTAGSLTVNTPNLTLDNNAQVTVSAPQGQAGNLTVNSNRVLLDNGSQLRAETGQTLTGESGANINVNGELLLLRNNSELSAQAFENADGGNININTANGYTVAVPAENSDLIAGANRGDGGRVQITANGIIGLELRPQDTAASDIVVSSTFGTDGEFIDNTPDLDPAQGILELPSTFIDASQQIATACPTTTTEADEDEFVITGRGGIPLAPTDWLESEPGSADWVRAEEEDTPHSHRRGQSAERTPEAPLVEAQGWIQNAAGQIQLIATMPQREANLTSNLNCAT